MLFLDQNLIINFQGQGKIRLFHPMMRTNVICSSDILEIFDALGVSGKEESDLEALFGKRSFIVVDATRFSLWECMMYNPDNFALEAKVTAKAISYQEAMALLKRLNYIHDQAQVVYPLAKKSPFDRMKGTLHQQLGSESMFRKISLDDWWAHQKFNSDMQTVKETPYKYIQEMFLEDYFKKNLPGQKVLEIGCGVGYFSAKMAQSAKTVIGIDYQKEYVDVANQRCVGHTNLSFYEANVVEDFKIKAIIDGGFDYIFLIDIFLFFFSPEFQNGLAGQRENVLRRLASLLSKGGKMVIMDPSIFWLIPRFGQANAPYGVITEYRHRHFRVIPTLEELTSTFADAGLLVSRILEPDIDQAYQAIDAREYQFIKQFPQWWVFELKKEGRA